MTYRIYDILIICSSARTDIQISRHEEYDYGRWYYNVTPSSLRRCQRAQLLLLGQDVNIFSPCLGCYDHGYTEDYEYCDCAAGREVAEYERTHTQTGTAP